jgi:uncharacterized protein (TIGR02118 family)
VEENVIKVSVLYPNTAGCKFDMEYYLTRHMPMVQQKLGPACKRMAVEQGIAGGAPGAPATYVAMGHLYFDSTDAFQAAFAPHALENSIIHVIASRAGRHRSKAAAPA